MIFAWVFIHERVELSNIIPEMRILHIIKIVLEKTVEYRESLKENGGVSSCNQAQHRQQSRGKNAPTHPKIQASLTTNNTVHFIHISVHQS